MPNASSSTSNTNTVNTQINYANLNPITKMTDKNFATCGDNITYTVVIPNTGNITARNVSIKDRIPNGTIFVTNSVFINGVQQIGGNPVTGVAVPDIPPQSTTTLTFKVLVQC